MRKECPDGFEWSERARACIRCPGGKIRSGGEGRGLGIGQGKGPIGRQ